MDYWLLCHWNIEYSVFLPRRTEIELFYNLDDRTDAYRAWSCLLCFSFYNDQLWWSSYLPLGFCNMAIYIIVQLNL